jgi:hypothetical protein
MRAVSLGGKEAHWDSKGNLSPGGNDTDSEGPPAQGPPAHCRRWQSRRVAWIATATELGCAAWVVTVQLEPVSSEVPAASF